MGKLEDAEATMKKNLEEKTGKSFDAWVALAKKKNFAKHGEIVAWLKSEHGMGHGYANTVAISARQEGDAPPAGEDLVAAQYAGNKAALMPIHDALVKMAQSFGKDVEISPKKTCVSLRRSKQFALFQPSTATRVDLGIVLKGTAPKGRLEAAGSFNAMVSHRVRLESVKDLDAEVKAWLKAAYDAA
ncbi:MAG: DUF4287 domain-containing protein [Betaproteobacteria bacterium]|nr:DUF4287 domain-containing protein [Betaproteobacteria bacterium]